VTTIKVPVEEWERLLKISKQQMAYRSPYWNKKQWAVILSTNARRDGWSFETYGHTPSNRRAPVEGLTFLEHLKREYLAVKPEGGRVFLDSKGAYYKEGDGKLVQFAVLHIPIRYSRPTATGYHSPRR
jgi:hypothetical protein